MDFTEEEVLIIEDAIQIVSRNLRKRVERRLFEYREQYRLSPEDVELVSVMCRKHIANRFDISMGDIELIVKDFKYLLKANKGVELSDQRHKILKNK